jgi:hypothetical protein
MNEAHRRFHDWLSAGAEGDPPRDLAVHASVCDGCRQSITAFDRLAGINPGLASMPVEPTGRERGGLATAGRLLGATAVLFSAAILGVGVSQLIGVERSDGPVAQGSPTPDQNVLAGTATPQPSEHATPSSDQETLTPLDTPGPTVHQQPAATPIPRRTPAPGPLPTPQPAGTPLPTAIPTPTPVPTPTPTPGPTSPEAPILAASSGVPEGIQLSWTAPIDDGGSAITSYRIYRGTTAGGETFLTEVTGGSYLDLTAPSGMLHWYVVTAVNAIGEGPISNEASATAP